MNFFAVFSLFPLVFQPPEQGFLVFSTLAYTGALVEVLKMREALGLLFICSVPVYVIYMTFNTFMKSETFIPLLLISVFFT